MKPAERIIAEGALFTDLYQLTMAQVYYRAGLHARRAQFDHFFRSYPDYGGHKAGYCINAGMDWLLNWMESARFTDKDIEYLRGLRTRAGTKLFDEGFLRWLKEYGTLDGIDIKAIPEGRVVHPNVPLTVVEGPLAMIQILETPLLNHLNFQTLVATKAARIKESSQGQIIMEFGMRRAQDLAANAGARAALIGGADFTSNTGVSFVLGYPPKGTHAHSMVQIFMALGMGELGAFQAYAEAYPDDCLLLVDTIDTLDSGIPNAIKVFEDLKRKGHTPLGIRIDSGDLAYLSIHAARLLDEAGFPDTIITLSSQLDELVIWQIITQIQQEASRYGVDPAKLIKRLSYGVGTNLITSAGDAALDGVYKLVAVENGSEWIPAIKLSENPVKTLNPGQKIAWRIYDKRDRATADVISPEDENIELETELNLYHPTEVGKRRTLPRTEISRIEKIHQVVMKDGKRVCGDISLEEIRQRRKEDMDHLDIGVKRLVNPHTYHVSITRKLWDLKQSLIDEAREGVIDTF